MELCSRRRALKASQIVPRSGWAGMLDGKPVAIYNNGERLTVLENVCPHRGCQTEWSAAQATWDCPCHGSRFAADGALLHGPARQALAHLPFTVDEAGEIRLA